MCIYIYIYILYIYIYIYIHRNLKLEIINLACLYIYIFGKLSLLIYLLSLTLWGESQYGIVRSGTMDIFHHFDPYSHFCCYYLLQQFHLKLYG